MQKQTPSTTDEPSVRRALDLYRDPQLWNRVQLGLLERVEERFGRERFRSTLVEALGDVGVAPPPGRALTAVD